MVTPLPLPNLAPPRLSRWLAALALALAVLVLIAAEFAYRPPPPLGPAAAETDFSAARALRVLTRMLGDEAPHPLGSAANAAVRERIVAELEQLGLEPEVQTALATRRAAVARVHNVVARIEGKRRGPAVLLAAHYDSVGAGPGASDDGAAVAAMLETARALLAGPTLEHPVILLIDDGEEMGLFGAQAFCEHEWAKEVAIVVNFEARGTSGASLLFETAGADLWSMRIAARALEQPVTGSAFAAVYGSLPNNTDLNVFRAHQMRGLNFAFIGGARRYHTPLDDIAHLDRGSLQHHGDNMLALARGLANAPDLTTRSQERALFFDVFGSAIVVVPRDLELPACGGLMLCWVVLCLIKRRTGTMRTTPMLLGLASIPSALVLAGVLGFGLALGMQAVGRLPTPFPPDPVVHGVCYGLAGLAAALGAVAFFGRRVDAWHMFAGTGSFLALTGTAVAILLPGSSYPCWVPSVVFWLGALLTRMDGPALAGWACLAGGVSAVMLAPFFALLPTAIGVSHGAAHAGTAAWGAMSLAVVWPILFGRRLVDAAVVSALAATGSVGLAMLFPAHDEHHPARSNIVHVSLDDQRPCWFFDEEPLPIATIYVRARPLPWEREGFCLPAPDLDVSAPTVECERRARGRGRFVVRGSIRSQREAPWLGLSIPPGLVVERAVFQGVVLDLTTAAAKGSRARREATGWKTMWFLGAEPDEEILFEITYHGAAREHPHVFDRTLGLPDAAHRLREARAQMLAAPIHFGDGVVAAAPIVGW